MVTIRIEHEHRIQPGSVSVSGSIRSCVLEVRGFRRAAGRFSASRLGSLSARDRLSRSGRMRACRGSAGSAVRGSSGATASRSGPCATILSRAELCAGPDAEGSSLRKTEWALLRAAS